MSISNSYRNKKSSKNVTNEKSNNEDNIVYNSSNIKKLYPSLSNDGQISNELSSTNKENSAFKGKKYSIIVNNNENSILSDIFLKELIKKPCALNKDRIIEVMSKFIQKSPLFEKFQKDVDKEVENNELSLMGAKLLNYMEIKKGQILFRVGDNGDRFYFVLNGKVSILKLKEINNVEMTYFEYIDYCMYLITQKENLIFNKVKNRNMKTFLLNSESEVISIYKMLFLKQINDAISHDLVPDTKSLLDYLKNYGFKLQDFNIKLSKLEEIENNELLKPEYKREEWNEYLKERCKPSFKDLMTYDYYKDYFKRDFYLKKPYTCFIYEPFLFLGKGLFFGDFALDSEMNKRNATIRAEEDTILAYMKSEDYINVFAPRRKSEKIKEINFIYLNYFFRDINLQLFEKSYFHLFSHHEYSRNYELFNFGDSLDSLILLKEGKVSLELKASILDLHDLIKYLWKHIQENEFFRALNHAEKSSLITQSDENRIREYIEDSFFDKLKLNGKTFMEEINKKKIYQVYIFANKEIIGLEEIYFGLPYIMRGSVVGNKISCYKIDPENLKKILYQEREIIYNYVQSSINKIKSLIKRLQNLKINQIKIFKNKFENEYSDSNELNKSIPLKNNFYMEKEENKMYKSPINLIKPNLNPIVQSLSIKKNMLNKKLNISNLNNSLDKKTNFSSSQMDKDEPLIKKYNSNFVKKKTESKTNNIVSKEDMPFVSETSNTKRENKITLSISSNKKSTRNSKMLLLGSKKIISYSNFIDKIKSNIKLKHLSLSGLNNIHKTIQRNSLIKKKLTIRKTSEKNILSHRKIFFNKKISKNFLERETNNEYKINSIWNRNRNRNFQLNNIKSVSMDSLIRNHKDKNDNNSNSINNISIINRSEIEKKKKLEISSAVKNFYNGIKSRGYSSFIRNKKSNTILNRKNNRKYLSDSSILKSKSVNDKNIKDKNQSNNNYVKLPIITDKNNKNNKISFPKKGIL